MLGFDRSGTSFCSQLLANHPNVECFIQPFSSTVVHKQEWRGWAPEESHPEVECFLTSLLEGQVKSSFIVSDWFENHSTTMEVQDGKLHIIKSTKLHHKVSWLRHHFPSIEFWGINRKIEGILCSLFRNKFYEQWYGDTEFDRFRKQISSFDVPEVFLSEVRNASSDLEKMTCMAISRIHSMNRSISEDRLLSYERLVDDPHNEFRELMEHYALAPYDFASHLATNYNITGKKPEGKHYWKDYFSDREKRTINRITAALSCRDV